MDLIAGYLLIIIILFSANLALLLGGNNINNIRLLMISFGFSIVSFVLMNVSIYLTHAFSFLMDYYSYLFFIIAIAIFGIMMGYRKYGFKYPFYLLSILFVISTLLFACQSKLVFIDMVLYSLFVFIIVFCVYKTTKLLVHAKRPYPVIVGEYMTLFSILMFIFAFTYNSTRGLDYTMFTSFLILTPTYQIIYMIIAVAIIMVIGVVLNENGGNS